MKDYILHIPRSFSKEGVDSEPVRAAQFYGAYILLDNPDNSHFRKGDIVHVEIRNNHRYITTKPNKIKKEIKLSMHAVYSIGEEIRSRLDFAYIANYNKKIPDALSRLFRFFHKAMNVK